MRDHMVFISDNMMSWNDCGLWNQKDPGLNQCSPTRDKAPFLSSEDTRQYLETFLIVNNSGRC